MCKGHRTIHTCGHRHEVLEARCAQYPRACNGPIEYSSANKLCEDCAARKAKQKARLKPSSGGPTVWGR